MTQNARQLLAAVTQELSSTQGTNELIELASSGRLSRATMACYVIEEEHIFTSDWGSYLTLAGRAPAQQERQFFMGLALGGAMGLASLGQLAAAYGADSGEPTPMCQAYPSYVAWLALNADPADVVFALLANFPTWCGYFSSLAKALREHHGLDDGACALLDALSAPNPQLEEQGLGILEARLAAGWRPDTAGRYARFLRTYDLLFWNTVAASNS